MDLGLTHQRQCWGFRNRGPAVATPESAGSLPAGLSLHKRVPSQPAAPFAWQTQALVCVLSLQQCPGSCQPSPATRAQGDEEGTCSCPWDNSEAVNLFSLPAPLWHGMSNTLLP